MHKLNILIIGTGMYACGRGTNGYGTIMPAVCEWAKANDIGEVYMTGRSRKGIDAARAKVKKLQKKMNVKLTVKYIPGGYKEAVRRIPKPACAVIAVPDNLHKNVATAAIEAGLHTLVVKPLVPTLKEALELIRLQEKAGVYCAVEFHKRYDYANLKLRDAVRQGLIGDPLYALAEFSQRKSIPAKVFSKWVESTNIFQYLGIHYIDIIYFATKALPKRVMALGQKNWLASRGIDTYDAVQCVIEWQAISGKRFTSYIITNWIDPESTSAMSDQKIKIIGTKGRFESDQKNRGVTIVTDEKGIEEINPYFCSSYGADGAAVYRGYGIDSIDQFFNDAVGIEEGDFTLDSLEGIRPTFKESLIPTAVLEAANISLKNGGKWMEIKNMGKKR